MFFSPVENTNFPGPTLTFEVSGAVACNPGDANNDGVVDLLDLDILGRNYGQTGAACGDGDFNGDGVVDLLDLDTLGQHYGDTYGGAVPEPATVGLLVLGGLVLVRRKRR